jgi:hypothetical protein
MEECQRRASEQYDKEFVVDASPPRTLFPASTFFVTVTVGMTIFVTVASVMCCVGDVLVFWLVWPADAPALMQQGQTRDFRRNESRVRPWFDIAERAHRADLLLLKESCQKEPYEKRGSILSQKAISKSPILSERAISKSPILSERERPQGRPAAVAEAGARCRC